MAAIKSITSAIVFSSIVGFLLNMGGYIEYSIISPLVFLVGQGLLALAIGLSNTPLAKGVAVASFSVWLFVFFLNLSIPLPSPIAEFIYAVLFVPSFVGAGLGFLELGKG